MAKHLNTYKFLILALLFYLAAIFVEKRQLPDSVNLDIDNFENVLHQKEQGIEALADSIVAYIEAGNTLPAYDKPFLTNEQMENLQRQGYTLLIYKDDSLAFWSDNLFEVPHFFNENLFYTNCVNLNNFWVIIKTAQTRDYKIVALYTVKREFPIQNKYLQNSFQKDLDLPSNISISLIPLSYGIDVRDKDGDYLFSLIPNTKVYTDFKYDKLVGILFLISLVFLVLWINSGLNGFYGKKNYFTKVSFVLSLVLIFRILMLKFNFPINIYSQNFFDSSFYASSALFPSLGDLFVNLLVILLFINHFFKLLFAKVKNLKQKKNQSYKNTLIILLWALSFLIFMSGMKFISDFVINSNIHLKVFNISELDIFSFVGFINIALILFATVLFLFKTGEFSLTQSKGKELLFNSGIGLILGIIAFFIFNNSLSFVNLLFFLLLTALQTFFILREKTKSLYFYSAITFISAVLVTIILTGSLNKKENDEKKLIAVRLTNERDDIAELLLKDIVTKLPDDQSLLTYAKNPEIPGIANEVAGYLKRRYFKTYWNKYNVTVNFCLNDTSEISQTGLDCRIKYTKNLQKHGKRIFDDTYFVSLPNGQTYYLVIAEFPSTKGRQAVFYIELSPKLYPANIGYPELLLDESIEIKPKAKYSFAKYENDKMVSKSGDYNYPLNGKRLFSSDKEFKFIDEGKLRHLIYTLSPGNYIVLTYRRITLLDALITFSYLFLFFIALVGLILLIINFKTIIKNREFNFRTKLIISLFLVLTLSFTLVGTVTVLLNIEQFKQKHDRNIFEKLQQINVSLEQFVQGRDSLKLTDTLVFSNYLREMSEIFGTDLNLYDTSGNLLASSRPEIYELHLIGKRMSPVALNKIKYDKFVQFVENERISLLNYSSAYARLIDDNTNSAAIINMPYFTNPDALKRENTNLIVSIINIYVVLFVIAMIVAVFISEQIISPLIVLQNKFKKLELGKKYEKIDYKRKDEIGQLVDEYNKMVDKLKESIEKLSKSERESAWRDMAKQIAHEIKNPLTPMKLSIQLLLRSWENQDEDFDERLHNVSNTLINQIETLRRIAEEFSDFAKMPKPQEQVINLADKIEEICKLYENTENVDVIPALHNIKDAKILADEKQISRALINLIKNAIQAIPDGVKGKIIVDLDVYADKVVVKIIDNGTGIPEEIRDKLFTPSFTTKSSGMGIGLTMVKNIVNNAKGKIDFKSEIGKGTTFILEFPQYKE